MQSGPSGESKLLMVKSLFVFVFSEFILGHVKATVSNSVVKSKQKYISAVACLRFAQLLHRLLLLYGFFPPRCQSWRAPGLVFPIRH
jgi:hypothetical protein